MMDMQRRMNREATVRRQTRALGWTSVGLGLAELFFARPMAGMLGMRGDEGLLRLYGLREIANGLGLLTAKDPTPWLWGRVAGDAVDITTLLAKAPDNPQRGNLALAIGAVAGITALDVIAAQSAGELEQLRTKLLAPDYSDRTGFPRDASAMRGAALKDFMAPRDFRVPEPMAPWERPPDRPPSVH
jgi:hypothetical protein